MKLLIELPDGYVGVVMRNQRIDGSAMDKLLRQAVIDSTPLDDVCEWEKGSSGYVGYPAYYSKCCATKSKGLEMQNLVIESNY